MPLIKPIPSTHQILAWKHLNRSVDEKWSQWAVEMMQTGFETEHLIELAGISKPFNQFELHELTNKVFAELSLDFKDQDEIITNYVTYLAKEVVAGKEDLLRTLHELKELWLELEVDKLNDFYSLYFAKAELNYYTDQYYWEGADRTNIDKICKDYLEKWIASHELE